MLKFLKYFLTGIFIFLLVTHIFLLFNGAASFITTFTLFTTLFFLLDKGLSRLRKSWKRSGFRTSYWMTLACLLALEFILRFYVGNHLAYAEENGNLYYSSPYNQIKIENKIRRYINKEKDVRFRFNAPGSTSWSRKPEFSYVTHNNSIGIRDSEYSTDDLEGKRVILSLGDSFCEGEGAPQDSTWTKLLSSNLSRLDSNFICINAGISGSDVFFEWYKLRYLLAGLYHPEKVILTINSTDIRDVILRGGKERFVSASRMQYNKAPWWEYLYSFSMLTRYIVHDVFNIQNYLMTESKYKLKSEQAVQSICDCILDDFLPFTESREIGLEVVFYPAYYELADSAQPFKACMDRLDTTKIEYLDLQHFILEESGKYDAIHWPIDMHYNSTGYKIMADGIFNHLEDRISAQPEIP